MGLDQTNNKNTSGECKVLLEACTPSVYRHNAFRITGLLADAPVRDIKRRIDDLKHAEELNDSEDEHSHAFALDPRPKLEHIREAAQRLQDPERRIVEEFFWFWPMSWGNGRHDPALLALSSGDKKTPYSVWTEALSEDDLMIRAIGKHNLAILYHMTALDGELSNLKKNLTDDWLLKIEKYWQKSFKWWEELSVEEEFWSLISVRVRLLDDPRLTTGFIRRLRSTLPEALDKINAMIALQYIENGKQERASKHIAFMKETQQGLDNIPKTLSLISAPLQTRIRDAIEKALRIADQNPENAAKAAEELFEAVEQPIGTIKSFLSSEDPDRTDLCDSVAEAGLACQIAYGRSTEDWTVSLVILAEAANFAASLDTQRRLAESMATVTNNWLYTSHLGPLEKMLDAIADSRSLKEQMLDIEDNVLPYLHKLKRLPEMTDDAYCSCADMVATRVRSISVSAYNENSDLEGAFRTLEIAIGIARGAETKNRLQGDKKLLLEMKLEASKDNLSMNIRSDEIEVTNEFIRYNNKRIDVSQIRGIKFGVFVHYTNGIKSSSSYLIEISGGPAGSIRIECKRVFRSEEQADLDYKKILQALFNQVVPSFVLRLAKAIIAGNPLTIGNCRLTVDGAYITTGSLLWKKETLVPFSDLRYGNSNGSLGVASSKNSRIITSMALREVWNAPLFEFIVKALIQMKSEM